MHELSSISNNRPAVRSQSRGSEGLQALETIRARSWPAARTPLLLVVALLGTELLGGRAHTAVLSGTVPPTVGALMGLIYVGLWLLCVVVVPPWLAGIVADGLVALARTYQAARRSGHDERAAYR